MRDNVIQSIRTVYLNPDLLLSEKYSINRINQRFIPRHSRKKINANLLTEQAYRRSIVIMGREIFR